MQFLKSFFISALIVCVAYFSIIFSLIEAPVPAEYWVAEMIAVKKDLIRSQTGKNKIIIAGGSSTLFGIDAKHASAQLGIPVFNFGLHAGLRLEKILREVDSVVEHGDYLILALEPSFYRCHPKWTLWQMNNVVGWDHDVWREMSYLGKIEFAATVSSGLLGQMIISTVQRILHSPEIGRRLDALDNDLILSKFRARTTADTFQYSAYNLDDHGDLLGANGSRAKGPENDLSKPDHICDKTANQLARFVEKMKLRGIQVYFANIPLYARSGFDAMQKGESSFVRELTPIGCIIDKRENIIFDQKHFFDSGYHLNSEGRSIRTDLLIDAIRKNIFFGSCTNQNS